VHYNGNRTAAEESVAECSARFAEARTGGAAGGTASGPPLGSDTSAPGKTAPASDTAPPSSTSAPGETAPAADTPAAAAFQADISKPADRERLLSEVLATFGGIDGLVNNAGIAPRRRDDIVYASEEIFDEVLKVNLSGPYFLTQLVARHWLEQAAGEADVGATGKETAGGNQSIETNAAANQSGATNPGGRIVFVTSVSATMASTSRGEYCVSKAALAMGVQLFAARLAGEGILCFEIRPGITKTDMTAAVTEKYDTLIAEGLVPQRRWGYPEDTGSAVAAIMDGRLDFCPGSVLYTDGGLHLAQL
jgi:NAD(P)-dependent dehydrogenase (short-subunit alcohol dehydrogenase family)